MILDISEKFEYVEVAYVLNLLTGEGGCLKEIEWKRARVFVSFFLRFSMM